MLLTGNYELWPPGHVLPRSGKVGLRFLAPIMPTAEDTVDTLAEKVRVSMETELARSRAESSKLFRAPGKISMLAANLPALLVTLFALSIACWAFCDCL